MIPLVLGALSMLDAQTVISHSRIPFQPVMGASISCNGDTPTQINAFSYENWISRSFTLTDFDVMGEFHINKVSFAVQNILNLKPEGFPVTVNLYTSEGAYPNGELTLIGTAETLLTNSGTHTVEVPIEATAPAGSEVVLELFYDGQEMITALYIGSSQAGDNQPAYIQSEICGAPTPTDTSLLTPTGIAKWLMSIEGEEGVLGIKDLSNSSEFTAYPNPVSDVFSIRKGANQEVARVELFDLTGKKVKSFGKSTENLSVSELPQGIYLIKIQSDSGKLTTQKLIKK